MKGWRWGTAGKHPVVKDYIRIGQETPLLNMLARWVEEGYHRVPTDVVQRSWRFFSRGSGRDELACGLVRDSRDGVGRSFPLLILGTGSLPGWEQRWESVASVCDPIWERMEYLASKRLFDLSELKGSLERLSGPVWPEHVGQVEPAPDIPPMDGGSVSVNLQGTDRDEIAAVLMRCRQLAPAAPEAVFIGGLIERPRLVVLMHMLTATDFERLWQVA